MISDIYLGVSQARFYTLSDIAEKACVSGRQEQEILQSQFVLQLLFNQSMDQVIELAGLPAFSWGARIVSYLTPALVTRLIKSDLIGKENPVREGLYHFEKHLNTCLFVANIVSNIAIIYFGQSFYGGCYLASLCYGSIHKVYPLLTQETEQSIKEVKDAIQNYDFLSHLPNWVKLFIHDHKVTILHILAILSFQGPVRYLYIYRLISRLIYLAVEQKSNELKSAISNGHNRKDCLDIDTFKQILNNEIELEVNRYYTQFPIELFKELPKFERIENYQKIKDDFIRIFTTIPWEKHQERITSAFSTNDHYRDQNGTGRIKDAVTYVQEEFNDVIKGKGKLENVWNNYPETHDFLFAILTLLKDEKLSEQVKADAIINLLNEGGQNCEEGYVQAIGTIYYSLINHYLFPIDNKVNSEEEEKKEDRNHNTDFVSSHLREILLHLDQEIRTRKTQGAIQQIINSLPKVLQWWLGLNTTHKYNRMMQLSNDPLNTQKLYTLNDQVNQGSRENHGIPTILLRIKMEQIIEKYFYKELSEDKLIHFFKRSSGDKSIPKSEKRLQPSSVLIWWNQKLENWPNEFDDQSFVTGVMKWKDSSNNTKEKQVWEYKYEPAPYIHFDDTLIKAMFYDMDFLQKKGVEQLSSTDKSTVIASISSLWNDTIYYGTKKVFNLFFANPEQNPSG